MTARQRQDALEKRKLSYVTDEQAAERMRAHVRFRRKFPSMRELARKKP